MNFNPIVSELENFRVIRDDHLPGGTKQRAGIPYVESMMKSGYRHFVYASPFAGFAQVALSYVCRELGVSCTIVCERDQRYKEDRFHPFSLLAKNYGAKIEMAADLQEAEKKAYICSMTEKDSFKIPLGFNTPVFKDYLKEALIIAIKDIELNSGPIRSVWLPIGSGTLASTFLHALPERISLNCVNVRVLEDDDPRITTLQNHPRVRYFKAPMTFHTEANDMPNIPSNIFYDAKLWGFVKKYGEVGDVWWNVAK